MKIKKIWSGEDFGKELEIDLVGKHIYQIYQDIKKERFFAIILACEPTTDDDYSFITVLKSDSSTRKYTANVVFRSVLEIDLIEHSFSVFELR